MSVARSVLCEIVRARLFRAEDPEALVDERVDGVGAGAGVSDSEDADSLSWSDEDAVESRDAFFDGYVLEEIMAQFPRSFF